MNEKTTISKALELVKNRINEITSNYLIIENNPLIKELHEIYEYLEYLNRNIKVYNEKDYYYREIVRVCYELIENEEKGRYNSLKENYPNLKEVFISDKELLTQRRKYTSYFNHIFSGKVYASVEHDVDLNFDLILEREIDFSSYIDYVVVHCDSRDFYEYIYPIVKICNKLKELGQYEKIEGYNHFIVYFNNTKLHVYQNHNQLYINDKELNIAIHKPHNQKNGYLIKHSVIDSEENCEDFIICKNLERKFPIENDFFNVKNINEFYKLRSMIDKSNQNKEEKAKQMIKK